METTNWMIFHRNRWKKKVTLRRYYRREIFSRIKSLLPKTGTVVEVGCGPGFLKEAIPRLICTDVDKSPSADCIADASALPFADRSISAYVGVDVLHHFSSPRAFFDCAYRSLEPSGKLILVEPWAGTLGYYLYRFVHHEECKRVSEPFELEFQESKDAMDGNAMISRQCLVESIEQLKEFGFETRSTKFFGSLSYLLTGGFSRCGLPWLVIAGLIKVEEYLPQCIMRHISFRFVSVIQKI